MLHLNSAYGGHLTNCLWSLDPKNNNLAFNSPQNVAPFLFRPLSVFFGKFSALQHVLFSTVGLCEGFLADSLASRRRLLVVTVLTGNFRPVVILRPIRMVVFRFLPRLSGFGCHFQAFVNHFSILVNSL